MVPVWYGRMNRDKIMITLFDCNDIVGYYDKIIGKGLTYEQIQSIEK
jgi:hypothetical protein